MKKLPLKEKKRNNGNTFSVVIVSSGRFHELLQCIGSLIIQAHIPDEIILIVQNLRREQLMAIERLRTSVVFPVRMYSSGETNTAAARNIGLRKSISKWTVFIDDDCVASERWLLELQKASRTYPAVQVIVGESLTYFQKNIYSLLMYIEDMWWKTNVLTQNNINDFLTLDTKNIMYSTGFMRENGLKFDTRMMTQSNSIEDSDMGLQLKRFGAKAIYVKEASVKHKDATTWFSFFEKVVVKHRSYLLLKKKWKLQGNVGMPLTPSILMKQAPHSLGFIERLRLLVVFTGKVLLDLFLYKVIR